MRQPGEGSSPDHWFEPLADHLGRAYLRYSFTKGTDQEVAFLIDALGLRPGHRVLDVGCGPGRHALALARAGIAVVGVDISQRFVDLARAAAPPNATFRRLDARDLPFEAEFDAAISLCQGAFGLPAGPDLPAGPWAGDLDGDAAVLAGMARALRAGGVAAVSAFSAYFQVRWLDETDRFDAERGVNHEWTELRDEAGRTRPAELWTSCYTPRELRLLAERCGLAVRAVWSVEPGRYAADPPTIDSREFLVVATKAAPDQNPPG